MPIGAGQLRERVAFDEFVGSLDANGDPVLDEAGNAVAVWTEQFRAAARIVYLKGGEPVLAARLSGTQPTVITVRKLGVADRVTTDWRIRDCRVGTVFNIRSVTPSETRDFIDFLCERGVAT